MATHAPAYLHPDDRVPWDTLYDARPDRELAHGDCSEVGGVRLRTLAIDPARNAYGPGCLWQPGPVHVMGLLRW